MIDALKNGAAVHDSLFWQPAQPAEGQFRNEEYAPAYVRVNGLNGAVLQTIYGKGSVVFEQDGQCAYLAEQVNDSSLEQAAAKVQALGGSVALVLKKLAD